MAKMEETTFDPRRRRLCPDGACVGLIGDNGRCKICGAPAGGTPPAAGLEPAPGKDEDTTTLVIEPDSEADAPVVVAGVAGAEGFDPRRRLCDDGACVGIVGANGLCSVCGRRAD